MKELSIEEKAKAYDEIIEKATKMHSENCEACKACIEELILELKESEGERIRQALIEHFKWNAQQILNDFDNKEVLAWLEAQGEQKPLGFNIGDEITVNGQICKVIAVEQKLAWSEEDIEMINWLIRCCEKEHEELCNDRYGHQEIVSDLKRDCRKKWDWLESLKNKVVPQNRWKPSEEQMDALHYVTNFDYGGHKATLVSLYEQLKKLKEE